MNVAGGGRHVSGCVGEGAASSRTTACTWTRPRAWYSATRVKASRTTLASWRTGRPASRASWRWMAIVVRRQSSPTEAFHRTAPA